MNNNFVSKLKNKKWYITICLALVIIATVVIVMIINSNVQNDVVVNNVDEFSSNVSLTESTVPFEELPFKDKVNVFAQKNGLDENEWSDDFITRGEENPEIQEFLLNYPLKKDRKYDVDLSEFENSSSVPLLIQWDERWGYDEYAGNLFGLTGCGPTCLSMVSIYLLDDTKYTPEYISQFSKENKYCEKGVGSLWSLIYEGGEKLGLKVKEIPNVEKLVVDNLKAGNPIICVVGPGHFTQRGHFIVLAGYENGEIIVNDPNSPIRSQQRWVFNDFKNEIKNMWACSK